MKISTLGLLHPGAMGSSLGAVARANLPRVLWASDGRGAATRKRAAEAGLEDVGTLRALVEQADGIVSVCPPDRAVQLAANVRSLGFEGIYADLNAIAPETALEIQRRFAGTPVEFVDGGIVGPPARRPGSTHLHLCGARAAEVAACFEPGPLGVFRIDGPIGAASALKLAFAAWTKGTSALLAAILAFAERHGVGEELLAEWSKFQPELPDRARLSLPAVAPKAWRFEGEMREIAKAFEQVGIPGGFHSAAAQIYARLRDLRDVDPAPSASEVVARLSGTDPPR